MEKSIELKQQERAHSANKSVERYRALSCTTCYPIPNTHYLQFSDLGASANRNAIFHLPKPIIHFAVSLKHIVGAAMGVSPALSTNSVSCGTCISQILGIG